MSNNNLTGKRTCKRYATAYTYEQILKINLLFYAQGQS